MAKLKLADDPMGFMDEDERLLSESMVGAPMWEKTPAGGAIPPEPIPEPPAPKVSPDTGVLDQKISELRSGELSRAYGRARRLAAREERRSRGGSPGAALASAQHAVERLSAEITRRGHRFPGMKKKE